MPPTPYEEKFKVGTNVRIQSRDELDRFAREWKYHNRLTKEQLGYADVITDVTNVGFYHGGDPLYTLRDAPGVWHEECLLFA
jgi:hypothetical protein